jgi:hypothetical protein
LGPSQRVRRRKNTKEKFNTSKDADVHDQGTRPASLVEAGSLTVYARPLLPNHPHLLVRTGTRPLARSMRSLLTRNGRCSWRYEWDAA